MYLFFFLDFFALTLFEPFSAAFSAVSPCQFDLVSPPPPDMVTGRARGFPGRDAGVSAFLDAPLSAANP